MEKINCCYLNTALQEIYYKQITGKEYYSLGFQTAYYYLFKNLKNQGLLCEKCLETSGKLSEIYLDFQGKYQNIYWG